MEEGEVVVGFAITPCRDPAFPFQPRVGALDGPAVARERVAGLDLSASAASDLAGWPGRNGIAGTAAFTDPRLDRSLTQCAVELGGVVAAICPQLVGSDPARGERVEERQQVGACAFFCVSVGG